MFLMRGGVEEDDLPEASLMLLGLHDARHQGAAMAGLHAANQRWLGSVGPRFISQQ